MAMIETGCRLLGCHIINILRQVGLIQRSSRIGGVVDRVRPSPVRIERQILGKAPFHSQRERMVGGPSVPTNRVELAQLGNRPSRRDGPWTGRGRSEEHTSELQSHLNLV